MSNPHAAEPTPAARPRVRRRLVVALVLMVGLAAVSAWMVKIMGPQAINPDYFCNCSMNELLIALLAWPTLAIACLVFALRLRQSRGVERGTGIVVGAAAIVLPVLAVLAIMYLPFPTIEELNGWAA